MTRFTVSSQIERQFKHSIYASLKTEKLVWKSVKEIHHYFSCFHSTFLNGSFFPFLAFKTTPLLVINVLVSNCSLFHNLYPASLANKNWLIIWGGHALSRNKELNFSWALNSLNFYVNFLISAIFKKSVKIFGVLVFLIEEEDEEEPESLVEAEVEAEDMVSSSLSFTFWFWILCCFLGIIFCNP